MAILEGWKKPDETVQDPLSPGRVVQSAEGMETAAPEHQGEAKLTQREMRRTARAEKKGKKPRNSRWQGRRRPAHLIFARH